MELDRRDSSKRKERYPARPLEHATQRRTWSIQLDELGENGASPEDVGHASPTCDAVNEPMPTGIKPRLHHCRPTAPLFPV